MSFVRVLKVIPSHLFSPALEEVRAVDWTAVDDPRASRSIFSTSTAIHLRVHKLEHDTPNTPLARADIVECADTIDRSAFVKIEDLIKWAVRETKGTHLGRVMLVNLAPGGTVASHVDRGAYFDAHFRFHIPLTTNKDVLFTGPPGSVSMHMPSGYLCQLLNQAPHGVENKSGFERIHLILDIRSAKPEYDYQRASI